MNKERIIKEIQRTAAENGGVAFGEGRFERETGISVGSWRGKFWRTWSEAVEEAGLAPNRKTAAYERDALVLCLVQLTREQRRFPTQADLRMVRQADATFPSHQVFTNLGDREVRIDLVRAYATDHPEYRDVLDLLPTASEAEPAEGSATDDLGEGTVYMVKHGRYYKIGHTFDVPRRHREIALELPEKLEPVHTIRTDDPTGIEAYWHKRFAAKRTNGEWFALTREDVRAFKRRRLM